MKKVIFVSILFAFTQGCSLLKDNLPLNMEQVLGLESVKKQLNKQPITTNFTDANSNKVLDDDFGNNQVFTPLRRMPRTSNGGYLLTSGFYEMTCKSYCIKAGTYGPSNGDGYLFAPLEGKMANIMQSLVREADNHPEVKQKDVQRLLWAIIAKAKFKNLSPKLKIVSAKLLTPAELLELNGGAVGLIPKNLYDKALTSLPSNVREIIRAESQMRKLLYNANTSYNELERIAVLTGVATVDRPEFKRGRWSKHKDGFYVRYYPSGYSKTKIQIYVPYNIQRTNIGGSLNNFSNSRFLQQIEYDATDDVAVPANIGSQRLLQSNEDVEDNRENDNECNWTAPSTSVEVIVGNSNFTNCNNFVNLSEEESVFGLALWRFSSSFEITNIQKVEGTWIATGYVNRTSSLRRVNMQVPVWENMSETEADEVCSLMNDLFTHELGHIEIFDNYLRDYGRKDIISEGETQQDAVRNFQDEVNSADERFETNLNSRQVEYDDITSHGVNQENGPSRGFLGGRNIIYSGCQN